jgi:hypothetical protein
MSHIEVKALEWEEARFSDKYERYVAYTILGMYEALEWSDGSYGGSIPAKDREAHNEEFSAQSIDHARAIAQSDFEMRIRSALIEKQEEPRQ